MSKHLPTAVFNECTLPDKPEADALKQFLAEKVQDIDITISLDLPANLGKGEIEAMMLYKKMEADYLLIDDNRARKVAVFNQIQVIGTLGFLLIAKQKGEINLIKPSLEKLQKSNLFLSDALFKKVLELADEQV